MKAPITLTIGIHLFHLVFANISLPKDGIHSSRTVRSAQDGSLGVSKDDCATHPSREKRDTSTCPSQDISPCTCDPSYNILTCNLIESGDQLRNILSADFPQSRLTKVQVKNSKLNSLTPGLFGTVRIREFEIQNNNIKSVEDNAFSGSEKSTLYINLNHNEIEDLNFGAISSVKGLRQLQLSHNHLTEIPDEAFGNLTKLDFLALNNNRIQYVGRRAFSSLPSLSFLDLSNNSITVLMEFSFHLSPQLVGHLNIILNSNNISRVDRTSFADSSPVFLAMMQNNLETLSREPFEKLLSKMSNNPTTAGLAIKGNPLKCDCRIQWLLQNRKLLNYVRHFHCIDGKLLNNMTTDELDCTEENQ